MGLGGTRRHRPAAPFLDRVPVTRSLEDADMKLTKGVAVSSALPAQRFGGPTLDLNQGCSALHRRRVATPPSGRARTVGFA